MDSQGVSARIPSDTPAIREALGMFNDGLSDTARFAPGGYVDLLQDSDVLSGHPSRRIFAGKLLPVLYERLWRPVVSRVFLGVGGPGAARERRSIIEGLEIAPGDRVLDVGCGTGNYTRHLAKEANQGLVIGFDASGTMLAKAPARDLSNNTVYIRGDACNLPFGDGEFDAVCSVGVLHMIDDWGRALDEMMRMLAPGGHLAIATLCARKTDVGESRGGAWVFGRTELAEAIEGRGGTRIRQQTFRSWQIVSAEASAEVAR